MASAARKSNAETERTRTKKLDRGEDCNHPLELPRSSFVDEHVAALVALTR